MVSNSLVQVELRSAKSLAMRLSDWPRGKQATMLEIVLYNSIAATHFHTERCSSQ